MGDPKKLRFSKPTILKICSQRFQQLVLRLVGLIDAKGIDVAQYGWETVRWQLKNREKHFSVFLKLFLSLWRRTVIFFLLALKYTLSLKSFCQIPVLSWDIRYATFQPAKLLFVSKSGLATSIKIIDIGWLKLDIMDDSKLISRMVFFRFGEINKSLFWVLSKS